VRARHLIADDGDGTRAWTAVCSTRTAAPLCETTIASFAFAPRQ